MTVMGMSGLSPVSPQFSAGTASKGVKLVKGDNDLHNGLVVSGKGGIATGGTGLLAGAVDPATKEGREAAIQKIVDRSRSQVGGVTLIPSYAGMSRDISAFSGPDALKTAAGREGLKAFASHVNAVNGGVTPAQDRADAMWRAFDQVGGLTSAISSLEDARKGIEYATNRLNGTLSDEQQNQRAYGPDGDVIYQNRLTMGDELSDAERGSLQDMLSTYNARASNALQQLERVSEFLGNSFSVQGGLIQKNDDGSTSLGAFKLAHKDYGTMMTSNGKGYVTMYDASGKGLDPLSYVQADEGLRNRYLATTVDIRF